MNELRPPCVTLPLEMCCASTSGGSVRQTVSESYASDDGGRASDGLIVATPRPADEREGMRSAPINNYYPPRKSWNRYAVWNGEQVQLVSLLMHSTPCVYLTTDRPKRWRSEENRILHVGERATPTRPLTPFESAALDRLKSGEEVAIQSAPGEIRMLGAVRARADCRNCHVVPVGTLLGAFSYRLLPVAVHDKSGGASAP